MSNLFDTLIEHKGIDSEFIDAWGKPARVEKDSQKQILKSLGYDIEDEAGLLQQLELEAEEAWLSALNPVYVCKQDQTVTLTFRVAIVDANTQHSLRINLENGQQLTVPFVPVDLNLQATCHIDEVEYHQYEIAIDENLPLGYHQLSLMRGRKKLANSLLIHAPVKCYTPAAIAQGKKIWGVSVQLYCIKSQHNWGVGDFGDLQTLILNCAKQGADFVGLNPIHALYPAEPNECSPYGPSSRKWLNYLYIHVPSVPAFDSAEVGQYLQEQNIDARLNYLRMTEFVDYAEVADVKLSVLRVVFKVFEKKYSKPSSRYRKAFENFIEAGGQSLQAQATFEALQVHLKSTDKAYWGWPAFPEHYQSYDTAAVKRFAKAHDDELRFFMFLQWQASEQFTAASHVAKQAGMLIGLYRDLAVGVSEGSAEIWSNKELYCTDISIGAPPDVMGPVGQKWGLPPIKPDELYAQGYRSIIDLFSSNMKASGALRIDHAMGLLRLWWVHKDDHADKGVYVNYPVDDLLAILALESHRHKSMVIGEDLGTVPQEIVEKLSANGVYSYRVFFFEQAQDGGFFSPMHYPVQSMATLTTHDMPTLLGFWHCLDLELGKRIGIYTDEDLLASLYQSRHEVKQQILNSLHGHQSIPEHISRDVNFVGMTQALNFGMQGHMASGNSALLSLQLEDWLQMDKPVNIPGTYNEYPNWRRKLSLNLEDLFTDNEIQHLMTEISRRRQQASTR